MATPPKQGEEQTEDKAQGSTPQLDRLEKLANTAATAAQAKQWRACRIRRSPRKCVTLLRMRKPGPKPKRQCG
jgi:hypothetical protein